MVHITVDPNQSSDEDNTVSKMMMRKKAASKQSKQANFEAQAKNEEEKAKLKAEEQKKKEDEAKKKKAALKKAKNNDPMNFLIKHGLTVMEANKYTQFSTEQSPGDLDAARRREITSSFRAQVFAVRKLRERILLEQDIDMNKNKKPVKSTAKPQN